MNIRIGYYGKDENVHSTFAKCMNVLETAKYLETVAETWEDAKRYVHLIQDNMIEHWGVDGYGDPLCTRISGVQNKEALIGLFLHMKASGISAITELTGRRSMKLSVPIRTGKE